MNKTEQELEKQFPKGDKSRGKALVLYAISQIELKKAINSAKKEVKIEKLVMDVEKARAEEKEECAKIARNHHKNWDYSECKDSEVDAAKMARHFIGAEIDKAIRDK